MGSRGTPHSACQPADGHGGRQSYKLRKSTAAHFVGALQGKIPTVVGLSALSLETDPAFNEIYM